MEWIYTVDGMLISSVERAHKVAVIVSRRRKRKVHIWRWNPKNVNAKGVSIAFAKDGLIHSN